jgi:hypothetical protein
VDVWESEEACNQFGEVHDAILERLASSEQPELYEARDIRFGLDSSAVTTVRCAFDAKRGFSPKQRSD